MGQVAPGQLAPAPAGKAMGPPVRAGGPIGWRDKSGCCLPVSGNVARVSRGSRNVARVSRVSGDVAVIRSIRDFRFCTALVRSVAWSVWSVAWSFRSGLVRTAGDRITGRRFTGVGS